ncbi:hypothetical protein H4W33_001069 [Kibdelosporangium phytohabitans]|nr:hypothetical protein [Kibdelosporangium phytohabitans]
MKSMLPPMDWSVQKANLRPVEGRRQRDRTETGPVGLVLKCDNSGTTEDWPTPLDWTTPHARLGPL